ncbi:MAG TPA: ABC transporter substrate-binding protein [Oscillospiraceae bacterium]|nr:ABC transporter substrate-binding protein [Oscillospiraceae bacterium]
MKRKIKFCVYFSLCVVLIMLLFGCEGTANNDYQTPELIRAEDERSITIMDPLGNEVVITKEPKKVVVLMNSLLDLWYLAGGTAVGRVSGTENVPPEAESIEILGSVGSPNLEKIIAMQPDLIIMTSTMAAHREIKDVFAQNKIETLYCEFYDYQDFFENLDVFTRITGRRDIFETDISQLDDEVKEIVDKTVDERKPKVLILFASSKSVTCELPTAQTGNMVDILGGENIVTDTLAEGDVRVNFSLEKIVESDPDVILITTMGDLEECKARIKEDVSSNQAWAGIRAVKEGNIHYLPKDLFMYKPNVRYPEAFAYLANILYPGVTLD